MSQPARAPRGWYPDPSDASNQRYWNGKRWTGRRLEPDIEGLRPTRLTFVAVLLALAGTALAGPFLGASGTTSSNGALTLDHTGWRNALWVCAFLVGSSSFVLALVSRDRERKRRSRSGKRWAKAALTVALVGACVWGLPLCAEVGSGL
jgi:multisubunit Na+/H+ antiporter MnhB subunit